MAFGSWALLLPAVLADPARGVLERARDVPRCLVSNAGLGSWRNPLRISVTFSNPFPGFSLFDKSDRKDLPVLLNLRRMEGDAMHKVFCLAVWH